MEIYFKKNKYLNDGKLDPREELRSFGEDKNSRANLEAALRALNEMDALKMQLLLSRPRLSLPLLPHLKLLPEMAEHVVGSVKLPHIQKKRIRDLEIRLF
ncbi:Protein CBG28055 [Caenorhabditis briggsae]|uniref:Protein CBG28055 n=1 Tax=Caenorhabditis briggsae TaxID=6238 RepID=B6IGP5_CAEBR|nr:Protein CBG28055 [Caenorhabditis briggsae]CAR99075.1 Protein CBG28055 [Caenorhabditis briggsae]